jgi:23S rRNA (adenine2503-C2)-methyltransferase
VSAETQLVKSRYDASREDIASILGDAPKYRLDQIWQGLYTEFQAPLEITTISKDLRSKLDAALPSSLELVTSRDSDRGGTTKFLWQLKNGGHKIESVLMHYQDRATVCVSTQAGCAMACGFCATGQAGFSRQLTAGEIVEQVVHAARTSAARNQRLANVVFMGMGEPLANEEAVWQAVTRIHEAIGISARHLTISTVGIIPGINTLADRPLPLNLAVSLHAARNDLRNSLVPINKRYPIEDLMQACRKYLQKKNRRVTFEWALIKDVNDTPRDARELAKLCKSLKPSAHVNLIPLNPTPGYLTKGSAPDEVREFADQLIDLGVNATVRRNRGTDIDAACGQLAAGQPVAITSRSIVG